jgi:hypothetical protein
VDEGGGEAHCATPDAACDGVLRADGEGVILCLNNADCDPNNIGIDGGTCTTARSRGCFLSTIVSDGTASRTHPVFGAISCVLNTQSAAVNAVAGLPGPQRMYIAATAQLLP